MEVSASLITDCLFKVRYFAPSNSRTTVFGMLYTEFEITRVMSLFHSTRRIVPELSVNTASCFLGILPLESMVSCAPRRVIRPHTLITALKSPCNTSETAVMPGLHFSSNSTFWMSKVILDSCGFPTLFSC